MALISNELSCKRCRPKSKKALKYGGFSSAKKNTDILGFYEAGIRHIDLHDLIDIDLV
jgi:hypothetical protein